jgi:predicted O-methyltransferase YrrM
LAEIKYSKELTLVKQIINNEYIYNMFLDYAFSLNNQIIKLNSNINVYEALFLSLLTKIYLTKKSPKHKLNILEIGLAYGTSSIIILNHFINYERMGKYYIFDPNQSTQWNSVGIKHIQQFIQLHTNNRSIMKRIKLYEITSTNMNIKKKIDISFIDGSHDEKIVIKDIINTDNLLRKNGLVIIDDVLHSGVKKAIIDFFIKNKKRYSIVSINDSHDDFIIKRIKNIDSIYNKINYSVDKMNIKNPCTMFCFIKH